MAAEPDDVHGCVDGGFARPLQVQELDISHSPKAVLSEVEVDVPAGERSALVQDGR